MNSDSESAGHESKQKPRIEVLPRDEERDHLIQVADLLAKALDTAIRIPGTSITIGLDPLIGLIPGIGDALAGLLGTGILGIAARLRLPRIVLARMGLNLLINGVVGAIPVVGDLFSVWFRSHARNAALLREAAMRPDRETRPDWLYVAGIIGGTATVMLLAIAGVIWLIAMLWKLIAV
ncbi:MAG: DUF4112 domain-containing protein [Nitrospira sp.]|nr:DUF4112 domain-containing protein [Nitrospira sp.]